MKNSSAQITNRNITSKSQKYTPQNSKMNPREIQWSVKKSQGLVKKVISSKLNEINLIPERSTMIK